MAKMVVTKLDAAVSHTVRAIYTYFEKDPLPALSLTWAANEILRDLIGGRKGVPASMLRDHPRIIEEYRKEYLAICAKIPNFLKHADKDPDATVEFEPDVVPLLLMDNIQMLGRLDVALPFEAWFLFNWVPLKFPNLKNQDYVEPPELVRAQAQIDPNDYEAILRALKEPRVRRGYTPKVFKLPVERWSG